VKASEKAYSTLVAEILNGSLEPGTLLTEVEQSSRLGISRTPLREALSKLSADGLVESLSGRGARVAPVSREGITRLYEMRRSLEELAARLAARRGDPFLFAGLADDFALAEAELTDSPETIDLYYDLNRRFDEAIDAAVHNDYLVSALRTIRQHATRFRRIARRDLTRLRRSAADTRVICEAIVQHEEDVAAHATHIHLHHSLRHILGTLPDPVSDLPTSERKRK
jgi:DNA-binding GntR family transcriptional regulator